MRPERSSLNTRSESFPKPGSPSQPVPLAGAGPRSKRENPMTTRSRALSNLDKQASGEGALGHARAVAGGLAAKRSPRGKAGAIAHGLKPGDMPPGGGNTGPPVK